MSFYNLYKSGAVLAVEPDDSIGDWLVDFYKQLGYVGKPIDYSVVIHLNAAGLSPERAAKRYKSYETNGN